MNEHDVAAGERAVFEGEPERDEVIAADRELARAGEDDAAGGLRAKRDRRSRRCRCR